MEAARLAFDVDLKDGRTAIRRIGREFLSERGARPVVARQRRPGRSAAAVQHPGLGDRPGGLLNHTIELLFGRALWEPGLKRF